MSADNSIQADAGFDFDADTGLIARDPNSWSGRLNPNWNIGQNPNGGYLAAVAMSALEQLVPAQPDPLSMTIHYLRPGASDEDCEVSAEIIRPGRTVSTLRAALNQAGKQRLEVLASVGNLGDESSDDKPALTVAAPDIPPPDDCVGRTGGIQGVDLAILNRLEIRLNPAHAEPGHGSAEMSGWVRFKDGRPPDAKACLLFADAFPPAILGLLGLVGWVPTIELTVHVRRRPCPGWIQARFVTHDLGEGRLIEDGMLWDEQGSLVAQSRQLALLLT